MVTDIQDYQEMRQGSICQGQMIQGGSVFLQSFVKLPFRVAQRMRTPGQKRSFKSWSYQALSSCVTLGALCDLSEPSSTWANSGTSPLHAVWHRVGTQLCLFSSLSNRTGLITFGFLPIQIHVKGEEDMMLNVTRQGEFVI